MSSWKPISIACYYAQMPGVDRIGHSVLPRNMVRVKNPCVKLDKKTASTNKRRTRNCETGGFMCWSCYNRELRRFKG